MMCGTGKHLRFGGRVRQKPQSVESPILTGHFVANGEVSLMDFGLAVEQEGYWLEDDGHIVSTCFVDVRPAAARSPIRTVFKAYEAQFVPEVCGTILISKPARFRDDGETLISDRDEARASRVTLHRERFNDPEDMTDAQVRANEANRAAELAGSSSRRTATSIKKTTTLTNTLISGKSGWVYCAAIPPTDQEQEKDFWKSMDPKYDQVVYINRPRAFALALSSMVADQCGPRGSKATKDSRFGDIRSSTRHKSQTIFHGPVLYVDDPYEVITSARNDFERMLYPMFVKRSKYRHQREYRFVIWTEEEPSELKLT